MTTCENRQSKSKRAMLFFAWLFTTKWQNEKVRSLRKAFVRSVFPEMTGNLGDDVAQRVTFVGD